MLVRHKKAEFLLGIWHSSLKKKEVWSAREIKHGEKRLRSENISILHTDKVLGSLCPGRKRPWVL